MSKFTQPSRRRFGCLPRLLVLALGGALLYWLLLAPTGSNPGSQVGAGFSPDPSPRTEPVLRDLVTQAITVEVPMPENQPETPAQ